jgi:hypothetical protein
MAAKKSGVSSAAAEKQLDRFIDKFDVKHRALIRAARAILRKRLPRAHELVYDNYNFLVIGYCSTDRPSDCIASLAAGASGVGLSFPYCGAALPDPHKLLLGSGSRNRFVRLESAETLSRPEIQALIAAACAHAKTPLAKSGNGTLVIRSVSVKQRARR